jgi:hypothetical protein
MEFRIYESSFLVPIKWSKKEVCGRIRLDIHFTKWAVFFCCSTGDFRTCGINPFSVLLGCLENAVVENIKYNQLKVRVRDLDFWQHL